MLLHDLGPFLRIGRRRREQDKHPGLRLGRRIFLKEFQVPAGHVEGFSLTADPVFRLTIDNVQAGHRGRSLRIQLIGLLRLAAGVEEFAEIEEAHTGELVEDTLDRQFRLGREPILFNGDRLDNDRFCQVFLGDRASGFPGLASPNGGLCRVEIHEIFLNEQQLFRPERRSHGHFPASLFGPYL